MYVLYLSSFKPVLDHMNQQQFRMKSVEVVTTGNVTDIVTIMITGDSVMEVCVTK